MALAGSLPKITSIKFTGQYLKKVVKTTMVSVKTFIFVLLFLTKTYGTIFLLFITNSVLFV